MSSTWAYDADLGNESRSPIRASKNQRRNINHHISLACGDRKMMVLLAATAIMFTMSMFFIAKALYPNGASCLNGNESRDVESCVKSHTYQERKLNSTIIDLVACKADKHAEESARKAEVSALMAENKGLKGVAKMRRMTALDLEAEKANLSKICKDLNLHNEALSQSYNSIQERVQNQGKSLEAVHGSLGNMASIERTLQKENDVLKQKDKTNEAIIDHLRANLLKSEFHKERKWMANQSLRERALAEADLAVYVYDLPEFSENFFNSHLENYDKRCKNQIGEHHLHNLFLNDTRTRVMDGEKADLYYVPVYTGCYRTIMGEELQMDAYDATAAFIQLALAKIKELPYWDRSQGRDHVWVFLYDYGVCLEYAGSNAKKRKIPSGLEHSILVGYVGDTTPNLACYNTWKDIVIPAYISNPRIVAAEGGRFSDPAARTTFAYFRGSITWPFSAWHTPEMNYSSGVRLQLYNKFAADPLFEIHSDSSPTYIEEMLASKFCLAPLGYSKWSFRFYEAIVLGCIPVIIADDIELPFEDLLDYRSFTVKIRQDQVQYLKDMLSSISEETIRKKQESLTRVWKHFVYNHPTKEGDAFDFLLNQLRRKVRKFQPASRSYWL